MAEGQSHDNFIGAKSFLVMPSYVMGDGFWDMTDKYGPYVDRIRPFFVNSLERRIYSVLEEFVYAENSSLAEHLPCLRRCLDAVTSWTVPLEAFCAKSTDESVAEETMRLAIKYLLKDGLIDGFVNSIVLNNRLNRICRELELMGIEMNFFPSNSKIDHEGNHSANHENGKSAGGMRLEITRGPGDSDLEVEIGSGRVETSLESSSSRKRARKRAATYDSPSNANIDPREPPESPFQRESSQDRFRISEDLVRRLTSAGNLLPGVPRKPGNHGKTRRSRSTLSYDLREWRNDWKNARLKLRIRRVTVAAGNCLCGGSRDDSVCRLTLPCKVDRVKTRIFRADPSLVEPCLIVMRRKFVNSLRNVCSCLDDVLRRIRRRRIEELCLYCEIRPSHIGFKLRACGGRKAVCFFAGRVPVCRNVRKQRFVTGETTPRDFTHLSSVSGVPGNDEDDSCTCNVEEKRLSFYSPCSNDSSPGSSKTGIAKSEEKCQWFSAESNFSKTNNSANYSGMHEKGNSLSTDKIHYAISTDNGSSSTVDLTREMFEENKIDCKCSKSNDSSVCNLTACVKNEDPSSFEEILPKGNCFCPDDCKTIELLSDLSARDKEEDRFLRLRSSGTNLDEVMKYSKYPSLLSPAEKLREAKVRCSCSKSASCSKLFEKKVHTDSPKNDTKVTVSPFVNEKKDSEVVSGIREVLDLVLAEAKDRFSTLQKENGQLFSVSVQTQELHSSSKAINVDLRPTKPNFNESDVKKHLETPTIEEKICTKCVDKLDIEERQIIPRNVDFQEEKQSKVNTFVEKVEISKNQQDFSSSVNEIFLKEAMIEYPKTFVSIEIQSNVKEFVIHPNEIFTPQAGNFIKPASIQKFEKGSTANTVREKGTIAHDRQDFGSNFNGTSSAKTESAIQKTFVSSKTQSSVKELARRWNKFSNFTSRSSVISEERVPSYRNRKLQVSSRNFVRGHIYRDTRSRNSISLGSGVFDCPSRCEGREKMYVEQGRYRLSPRIPRDRKCARDDKNGGVKGRRSIDYCRAFPRNSIDRLRHLIRGKLSRVLLLDKDKASDRSKTFLRNDKYLVSVFRAKVSRSPHASTISAWTTATKSHVDATESPGNSFPGHGTTMETRMKNYGNPLSPRLPGGSEGNPNDRNPKLTVSYTPNSRSSKSFQMHRQRCNKLRERYCCIKDFAVNRISDLKGETRDASYQGHRRVKNVSNVLTDFRDDNRVKIKGELNDTRKCNDRFDKKKYYPTFEHSCCYGKENCHCQSIFAESGDPTRQNFQPFSKWYFNYSQESENSMLPGKNVGGNFAVRYCDKRMNDLSVNFRTKLARYVELCKSVKFSILNKLRPDDIYEVSTTSIPSTYANKYNINTGQYYESNR